MQAFATFRAFFCVTSALTRLHLLLLGAAVAGAATSLLLERRPQAQQLFFFQSRCCESFREAGKLCSRRKLNDFSCLRLHCFESFLEAGYLGLEEGIFFTA